MSKLNSVRKGDQAEYIAQGIFSALGYSIQILRQEDYGIDFLCTLTEKSKAVSYPTKSFTIQLKTSDKNIIFPVSKLKWVENLKLPFIICQFDNAKNSIDFYFTSQLYHYLITKPPSITKISFRHIKSKNQSRVHLYSHNENNKIFVLPTVSPFLSIAIKDLSNESLINEKKNILEKIIDIDNDNIMYKNLSLPFMKWVHKYKTNNSKMEVKWAHFADDGIITSQNLLKKIGHIILSLTYTYKSEGKDDEYNKLKEFVLKLPFDSEFKSELVALKFRNNSGKPLDES